MLWQNQFTANPHFVLRTVRIFHISRINVYNPAIIIICVFKFESIIRWLVSSAQFDIEAFSLTIWVSESNPSNATNMLLPTKKESLSIGVLKSELRPLFPGQKGCPLLVQQVWPNEPISTTTICEFHLWGSSHSSITPVANIFSISSSTQDWNLWAIGCYLIFIASPLVLIATGVWKQPNSPSSQISKFASSRSANFNKYSSFEWDKSISFSFLR